MSVVTKFLLPLIALGLLAFAVVHVVRSGTEKARAEPPFPPSRPPEEAVLSAHGVVEARGGNVAVASAVPGVIAKVYVKVGQHVPSGQPLFSLNDAAPAAALRVRQAQVETAQSRLARLLSPPRRDDLDIAASKVKAARADHAAKRAMELHADKLYSRALISEFELEQRKQATVAAEAQAEAAEAERRLLLLGATENEKSIAKAQVAEALALVEQARAELSLLTTRAPADGTVLQINVRPGETVGIRPDVIPIVLGDVEVLHLRVELEEHLIGRFRPNTTARAVRRGDGAPPFPITYERTEPLLVAKRALGGFPGERSDTRVLQVIYQLPHGEPAFRVGQLLDVFLPADPP